MEQADDSELLKAKELANAYNRAIVPGTAAEDAYSQNALWAASRNYNSQLNLVGNGIMGYVEIPKINVNLPIYYGTENDSLERGIGHLLGSSLPVGGESIHTILSGHSGMASQKMFTDLEQLIVGDMFYLHVLNETLAYQVVGDQHRAALRYRSAGYHPRGVSVYPHHLYPLSITNLWERLTYRVCEIKIIDPQDVEEILIQPGQEPLTLLTCHPYASGGRQRYVVYCERVESV